MSDAKNQLARHLKAAVSRAEVSVESLAERTKVPRSTILHLMGEPVSAILPERVYLRGHLAVLARELDTDVAACEGLFDEAYPNASEDLPSPERQRFRSQSVVVGATLGGVAVLSVVAAFVSALD